MTKEDAKTISRILNAFAEGKVIECRTKPSSLKDSDTPNEWTEMKEFEFWNNTEYRIKPEPKYRPFVNAEECWQEMQKHQPFGWAKDKSWKIYDIITRVTDSGVLFSGSPLDDIVTYSFSFDRMAFSDGTLFGVKEEK